MHILNLVLLYGIGLRDNVKTQKVMGEDGIERKVQDIVTRGGAFPRGSQIIQCLRSIFKYFGTSQRLSRLRNIQDISHGPMGAPILDGKTRVASCHRLLQSSILHFWTMQKYYESVSNSGDDFKGIWEALNSSDWQLIQEMEAIIKDLARYALKGSQTDSSLPSEILIYRKVSMGVLQRQSFHLLLLNRHDQRTTLADLEQTRKNDGTKKELVDLSANGKICLERIKGQIRSRFVDAEEPKTYIPLFLDPRTVPFVNHIIPEALKEGTLRLFTEMVTNVLNFMIVQKQPSDDLGNSSCRAPHDSRASNNDISGIAGDSGSESGVDFEDDFVLKASSRMFWHGPDPHCGKNPSVFVNSWIDHCNQHIDWSQFLRSGNKDNDVNVSAGQATHKLSFNNRLTRLQACDPMLWFNQVGKTVFPEVAILVKLEFAKVDSSAGSTGAYVFSSIGCNDNQANKNVRRSTRKENRAICKQGVHAKSS